MPSNSLSRATTDFLNNLRGKEDGQTMISSGPNRDEFSYGDTKRPDMQKLENAARDFSVFTSINLFAQSVYGEGLSLNGENKKALDLCLGVTKKTSFKPILIDGIRDTFVYGIGAIENIWSSKTEIQGFKIIDVKSFEPKWDAKGNITGYSQKPQGNVGGEPIPLKKEEVTFIRFYRTSDQVYGIGLVEPVIYLLEARQDMIQSIRDIFKFLAFPPIHVIKTGAKNKIELKQAEQKLKNFHKKHFFVTNEKYEMRMLEVKRAVPELTNYLNVIDNYISVSLRIPNKILSGDMDFTTRASGYALREYGQDEKSFLRSKVALILQEQVFTPLCLANGFSLKDVPEVIWNSDISEDPETRSKVAMNRAACLETLTVLLKDKNKDVAGKAAEILNKL